MDGINYRHVAILDTTVITSVMIFLHYQSGHESAKALAIAPDSLPLNDFRRLTVQLTLAGGGQIR